MASKAQAVLECKEVVKNDLAANVLVDKYFLFDGHEYHETKPQQMWRRFAKAISAVEPVNREAWEAEFYDLCEDFKFVPGGRIMYALGNPYANATLKNCYVIGILDDSIKGIFDCAWKMAETYKAGGGCGTDLSPLRPKGSILRNAAKIASGATTFMDFYSHITGMIGQNGRIGALLLCIDVKHPDVIDFIKIKGGSDLNKIRYANVSVKIHDDFMRRVKANDDFDLEWGGKVYATIKAKALWDLIIDNAWRRAEPGLLFWDTTLREYPAAGYPKFCPIATNPCGELALSDGDSCDLGSINLGKFVVNSFKDGCYFDYDALRRYVKKAVRFLDNIITLEKCPLPFQQEANDTGRRLGLGFMGLADVFMRMKMRFDSPEAMAICEKICQEFAWSAYDASCDLAEEKGPFPAFDLETHFKSAYIKRLPERIQARIKKSGIRNVGVMAIAPTGSLSCVAECSSGLESAFRIHYIRKTNLGTAKEVTEHDVWHPAAKEYADTFGVLATELPDYFQGSDEIDPVVRVKMQGVIQRYIDQSISNTVNLPKDCTREQIGELYMLAWEQGLKGITVYRDGSREGVLVTKNSEERATEVVTHYAPKRPENLKAKVHVIKPNGKAYTVFVGFLGDKVYEVFAVDNKLAGISDGMEGHIVKTKSSDGEKVYNFVSGAITVSHLNRYEDSDASTVTRLISTALRHGTPLPFVIDQISKSKDTIGSFSRAIAKALSKYMKKEEVDGKFKCPKCQSKDIKFEGCCKTCLACGWSLCS